MRDDRCVNDDVEVCECERCESERRDEERYWFALWRGEKQAGLVGRGSVQHDS
jgi:hypothetical protein